MDFVGPLPEIHGFNYLWVVICRLTSQVHLIPCHTTNTATDLSRIFLKEVVRLHGLPESIVSDRDSKFTSTWWKELHRLLGTKLLMSTAYHPQTDGITERANRSVAQIFRASIRADQRDWLGKTPLVEFAINSSINETTGYAPFELVHGYMPRMLREVRYTHEAPPGVRAFAVQAMQNLYDAHDAIIASRVFQTHHANKKRKKEFELKEGDQVYLSTKNLTIPKARTTKLSPKFVGPYRVLDADSSRSVYSLDLPEELKKRRVHNKFHISLLRPYVESDAVLFPDRTKPEPYDFGAPDSAEEMVEAIVDHEWHRGKLWFNVLWSGGDQTLEPITKCKKLKALDAYLELQGISNPINLPDTTQPRGQSKRGRTRRG